MKPVISIILGVIFAIFATDAFAQSHSERHKDKNIERIYSFYYNYKAVFDQPSAERIADVSDSLIHIYCTQELCNIMIDDRKNGLGYDFMTDNYEMDDLSLKTLKVTAEENYYIVSYQVMIEDYNRKVLTNVKLQVEMGDGKICRVAPVGKKAAYE